MPLSFCSNSLSPLKLCRMSSSILTLKRVAAAANPKCASSSGRFFCNFSFLEPLAPLLSHAENLGHSISPSLVSLAAFFDPDDRKIYHSCRGGAGVLLDPKLIVTSAHVVGRVSTSYESGTAEKPGQFDKVIHTSCIGSTSALTSDLKTLKTRTLAVNFASDIAVLELVNPPEETSLSHCALASSTPEEKSILMAVTYERGARISKILASVRAVRYKTVRAKAPWPRDDDLGWIEHDWFFSGYGGPPPAESVLCTSSEKVTGSLTRIPGGPWFNMKGEVVGISSWEMRDDPAKFMVGFAVPPPCINAVLDYAKMKGPEDPIVMDPWIDSHIVFED